MVKLGPTAGEALCCLAIFAMILAALIFSIVFGIKRWKTIVGKMMVIVPGTILSLMAAACAYLILFNVHRILFNYFNNRTR